MISEPPDARDDLRWVVENRRRVFGGEPSLEQAIAFVAGFDNALKFALLRDFQMWLVVKLGGGFNVHWIGLARRLSQGMPLTEDSSAIPGSTDDGTAGGEFLELVMEFLDAFDVLDERRRTYAAYERLRSE